MHLFKRKFKRKIMECHVEGYTALNYNIPEFKRGKFLGLCDTYMINHFKAMKITHLQLMPIFDSTGTYWGYDPISLHKHNLRYGSRADLCTMIKTLHANDIKVILDVVYNHTHHVLPELTYYPQGPDYPDFNFSGCGDTVNVPESLPQILKSIRYWLREVGVDGMRFDLCHALCRENGEHKLDSTFITAMDEFKDKLLIAEPWDTKGMCYDYPDYWLVLNGDFRNHARRGLDYFYHNLPKYKALDFITCHDGYTLEDLVSYEERHNECNGEDNRDGCRDNDSCNHGVEGPTTDVNILNARRLHKEYLLGRFNECDNVLLYMGDELGNSQNGCNNAYLNRDATTYVNWPK